MQSLPFLQWCIQRSMGLGPWGEQHKRGSSPRLDSSATRPGGRLSCSHRWSHSLSPLLINLSDFHCYSSANLSVSHYRGRAGKQTFLHNFGNSSQSAAACGPVVPLHFLLLFHLFLPVSHACAHTSPNLPRKTQVKRLTSSQTGHCEISTV